MARLLMFNIRDEAKRNQLKILSLRLSFSCQDVPPEKQGLTLRGILIGQAPADPPSAPFQDEMLVLNGFVNEDLDFLLQEMRRTHTTVALKAVVTETNQYWTPLQLRNTLITERLSMKGKA